MDFTIFFGVRPLQETSAGVSCRGLASFRKWKRHRKI